MCDVVYPVRAGFQRPADPVNPPGNPNVTWRAIVTSLDEQLTKYLTDAHAIEEQALVQMKMAPKIAGDPEIATAFERAPDRNRGARAG